MESGRRTGSLPNAIRILPPLKRAHFRLCFCDVIVFRRQSHTRNATHRESFTPALRFPHNRGRLPQRYSQRDSLHTSLSMASDATTLLFIPDVLSQRYTEVLQDAEF
eukprot:Gb_07192 [translate_table: standard]